MHRDWSIRTQWRSSQFNPAMNMNVQQWKWSCLYIPEEKAEAYAPATVTMRLNVCSAPKHIYYVYCLQSLICPVSVSFFVSLLPCELWDWASPPDLLALWKSDFIKSLIRPVIYTVYDECHQSRCVDLMAALICLFNGVVEWKVATARRGTKRWVIGPAGKRWKGKMQNSQGVEERGGIKQGLCSALHGTEDRSGPSLNKVWN